MQVPIKVPKVGSVVVASSKSDLLEEGMKGIVYEQYDRTLFDQDPEDNVGVSLIFENGFYCGFSKKDMLLFDIQVTGRTIPELEDYQFLNVNQLSEDFCQGKLHEVFKGLKAEAVFISWKHSTMKMRLMVYGSPCLWREYKPGTK